MIKQFLLKKIYRIKHYLRLNFYFKPRRYECIYEVTINNNSNEIKQITVVMPVPQDWPQQKISNVLIGEKGETVADLVYKNRYFVSTVSLASKSNKKIIITFTADISPMFTDKNSLSHINTKNIISDNRFIATTDPVKQIVKKTIPETLSVYEKVKNAYDYVIGHLTYGDQIDGLYSATQALTRSRVDCGGYVTLLCSLLKTVEIPCIPVFGFFANHTIENNEKNSMHAWGYIPLNDRKCFPIDPSEDYLFRHGQSFTSGGLGWVGSDRIIFSHGCDFEIKVDDKNIRVDILQNAMLVPPQNNVTINTIFKTRRC